MLFWWYKVIARHDDLGIIKENVSMKIFSFLGSLKYIPDLLTLVLFKA